MKFLFLVENVFMNVENIITSGFSASCNMRKSRKGLVYRSPQGCSLLHLFIIDNIGDALIKDLANNLKNMWYRAYAP